MFFSGLATGEVERWWPQSGCSLRTSILPSRSRLLFVTLWTGSHHALLKLHHDNPACESEHCNHCHGEQHSAARSAQCLHRRTSCRHPQQPQQIHEGIQYRGKYHGERCSLVRGKTQFERKNLDSVKYKSMNFQ